MGAQLGTIRSGPIRENRRFRESHAGASTYYNEIDRFCCDWLSNLMDAGLITPGKIDDRRIEELRPDDVRGYGRVHFFAGIAGWDLALQLAGWPTTRPVWTGSCPCQPFSTAGRRKAADDERHLWPAWFELIRNVRPPIVFGEQVEAAIGWAWLDVVHADMAAESYALRFAVLPACGVGAPHIRNRLWFVAQSDSGTGWQGSRFVGGQRSSRSGQDSIVADIAGQQMGNAGFARDGTAADAECARRPEGWTVAGNGSVASGGSDIVAEPADPRRRSGRLGDEDPWRSEGRRQALQSGRLRAANVMADAEPQHDGCGDGRAGRRSEPADCGLLGQSDSGGLSTRCETAAPDGHGHSAVAAGRDAGVALGDANEPRLQERECDGRIQQETLGPSARQATGSTSNPWAELVWLSCSDGKARPALASIFPLVDGLSFRLGSGSPLKGKSRVGMLRAAGNAIVPQVAAEFIKAFWKLCHQADEDLPMGDCP